MKTARGGRFEELDVLRGVAAISVVLSHYTSYCVRYFGEAPFHVASEVGYYAVELFFMISGFVIYFTLEKSNSWKDFVISRVTRLYPTYWATLILVTCIEVTVFHNRFTPDQEAAPGLWLGGFLANITMLQEFFGFSNFDNVYWSLTFEVAFYANMLVLFTLGLLRRIEGIALSWLALAASWPLIEPWLGSAPAAALSRCLALEYAPFFVAGIMFYRINSQGSTVARLAIVAAALAVAGVVHGLEGFVVAVVLFGIFALTVAGMLRFLVSPATLWLGAISYPLYLSHRNLGYSSLLKLHEAGVSLSISLVVVIVGALALATVLCFFWERPVLRFLRERYRIRRKMARSI